MTVGGSPRTPSVVDRRRLELAGDATPRPVQPYHASEGLPVAKAEKIVDSAIEEAHRFGQRDLGSLVGHLRSRGHEVAGCILVTGSGRKLPALADILASHALIHAAEGEMFREALRWAAARLGVTVFEVREKEIFTRGTKMLGITEPMLRRRTADLGRAVGPPWAADQKLAATAAWLALAGEGR